MKLHKVRALSTAVLAAATASMYWLLASGKLPGQYAAGAGAFAVLLAGAMKSYLAPSPPKPPSKTPDLATIPAPPAVSCEAEDETRKDGKAGGTGA